MATETTTTTAEYEKGGPPPAMESKKLPACDALLRVLLVAASVVVVVVMATSNETELIHIPSPTLLGMPFISFPHPAKFTHSPALLYLVVAFSVTALYSIVTGLASLSIVWKPSVPPKWLLILISLDVVMLGIVASATGTAGGVAYVGLKGNSHVGWGKICNIYGKFCRHVGSSVIVALIASFVLVLLVISNTRSLYHRVPPNSK